MSRKMQMHTCAISEESSTFELNGARLIVVLNGRFSFLNIRNATRGGVFCRMARLISAQSCPPASASSRSVRSRASPDSHLRTSSFGTLQEHPCTSQHLPPPPLLQRPLCCVCPEPVLANDPFQINMPLQEKTVSHLPRVCRASAAVAVGVAAAEVECKASTQKTRRSAPPQQPCRCRHYYRHS